MLRRGAVSIFTVVVYSDVDLIMGYFLMCEIPSRIELDARGLSCPMPLLKLKQQLNCMQIGQWIEVKTTDPGSLRDFAAFTAMVGHIIHGQSEQDNEYLFIIEKRV